MELIEAKALANIRPKFDEDGNAADIVRKGDTAWLTVEELERYVDIGAVEAPKYRYVPPTVVDETPVVEESKRGPGRPKKVEGGDA